MNSEAASAHLVAISAADPEKFTMEEVMSMLDCSQETVVERIQSGDLVGVKFGRGWIFPRAAFLQRLNELALEVAAARRVGRAGGGSPAAAATAGGAPANGRQAATGGRRGRRAPPALPALPQH